MRRLSEGNVDIRLATGPTEDALAAAIPPADAVILVNEQPALTAGMIAAAARLRVACRNGAGFDNFDVPALTRRGIPLVTTGDANADAVAEHAIHLLLALAKRGPAYDRAVKGGTWSRGAGAVELRGKTAAIIGWGRIGRRIGARPARRYARGPEVTRSVRPEPLDRVRACAVGDPSFPVCGQAGA